MGWHSIGGSDRGPVVWNVEIVGWGDFWRDRLPTRDSTALVSLWNAEIQYKTLRIEIGLWGPASRFLVTGRETDPPASEISVAAEKSAYRLWC